MNITMQKLTGSIDCHQTPTQPNGYIQIPCESVSPAHFIDALTQLLHQQQQQHSVWFGLESLWEDWLLSIVQAFNAFLHMFVVGPLILSERMTGKGWVQQTTSNFPSMLLNSKWLHESKKGVYVKGVFFFKFLVLYYYYYYYTLLWCKEVII